MARQEQKIPVGQVCLVTEEESFPPEIITVIKYRRTLIELSGGWNYEVGKLATNSRYFQKTYPHQVKVLRDAKHLQKAVVRVLNLAIATSGSNLDDFLWLDGDIGESYPYIINNLYLIYLLSTGLILNLPGSVEDATEMGCILEEGWVFPEKKALLKFFPKGVKDA